jgi:uncharacterized protein YukE
MTSPNVPIGAGTEMWPEQSVQVVIEWAEKAGQATIRGIIDEIRDWLGHPEEVSRIARLWSDASGPIGASLEGIATARADLKAYWQGTAHEAFNSHMDLVTETITKTQTMLGEEAKQIMALRTQITQTYNSALTFISDCARAIYNATSTLLGQVERLVTAVPEAVIQALMDFTANVNTLATNLTTIMTEYAQGMLGITQLASDLRVPDDAPRAISEPDNWTVNEANR